MNCNSSARVNNSLEVNVLRKMEQSGIDFKKIKKVRSQSSRTNFKFFGRFIKDLTFGSTDRSFLESTHIKCVFCKDGKVLTDECLYSQQSGIGCKSSED